MSPVPKKLDSADLAKLTTEEVQQLLKNIDDIRLALIGDAKFGHRGLVQRMSSAERLIVGLAIAVLIIGGDRVVHLVF